MSRRAAIVTGASRGIGRAIAEMLGDEGFDLTITARRSDGLSRAADELRERGLTVEQVAANLASPEGVEQVVAAHRDRFGRLDVLVNNAGIGVAGAAGDHELKFIDMQFAVNLRTPILFYKHGLEMLRAAGAEHGAAIVVNVASMAGVVASPGLSVYGAAKAAVIAYTRSMNAELGRLGIKSVALCPGWVDTDMAEFMKDEVPAGTMLPVNDVAEAVRFVLRVSPQCIVPQIVLGRASETGL
jgi:NAD(P)-dependent dehydrogenase (short-subunit alcohol dehydrogenase family)